MLKVVVWPEQIVVLVDETVKVGKGLTKTDTGVKVEEHPVNEDVPTTL